jgi:hypothetical protein
MAHSAVKNSVKAVTFVLLQLELILFKKESLQADPPVLHNRAVNQAVIE